MLGGCGFPVHRQRSGRLTQRRGALVGRGGSDAIGAGRQGDAPESFVIDLQGLPCLLDLPVGYVRTGRHLPQERLDLRAAQVAPASSGMLREEPADPSDAERNGLFLGPHFSATAVQGWPVPSSAREAYEPSLLRYYASPYHRKHRGVNALSEAYHPSRG